MDNNIIDFSLHFNFEVRDSEMYGGVGTVGYASTTMGHCKDLSGIETLDKYMNAVERQRVIMAEMLKVPVEKVIPISYQQYVDATEEDGSSDDCDDDGFEEDD